MRINSCIHHKSIGPHELIVVNAQSVILIDAVDEYLIIGCRIKKMSVEVRIETFYLIEV